MISMTHGTAKNKQQHFYINNSGTPSYSSSSTSSSNSSAVASSTANNNENEPGDFLIGYGAFGVIWAVTDPRTSQRVALKKMPNVFQSVVAARRAFREIKMLCTFRHDNILQAVDILQPPSQIELFNEVYILTELMQIDLHKIIVSQQALSIDHCKVFLYQILRGLKFLHSAGVIHRDLKPGNLLVNSDCLLKICDFGLARTEELDKNKRMTQEVVTQYYRAAELLLGAQHYSYAIDVWSVGCIFAELLGRRILFQASSPLKQLDLILNLLGSPPLEEISSACDGAKSYILSKTWRAPKVNTLYSLSKNVTHEAVQLLLRMLTWDPKKRITINQALENNYIHEGRIRYHSCMCRCCFSTPNGRQYTVNLEPVRGFRYDDSDENFTNLRQGKEYMHKLLTEFSQANTVPLRLNHDSPLYKTFATSQVAQAHELPPSPVAWDKL
jgi:nemo like kinase